MVSCVMSLEASILVVPWADESVHSASKNHSLVCHKSYAVAVAR